MLHLQTLGVGWILLNRFWRMLTVPSGRLLFSLVFWSVRFILSRPFQARGLDWRRRGRWWLPLEGSTIDRCSTSSELHSLVRKLMRAEHSLGVTARVGVVGTRVAVLCSDRPRIGDVTCSRGGLLRVANGEPWAPGLRNRPFGNDRGKGHRRGSSTGLLPPTPVEALVELDHWPLSSSAIPLVSARATVTTCNLAPPRT